MKSEKEIQQLLELARANWEQSFESSRTYGLRALKIAEDIGSIKLIADACNNLSVAHFYIGDYEEALAYGKRALDCIQNLFDPTLTPSINNSLGMAYFRLGRLDECLFFYLKSLYYAVRSGNPDHIAVTMCNLGGVFWQASASPAKLNRNDAIEEFKRSIEKEIKPDNPIAELVRQFHELDNRELGYQFFNRAMHIIKDNSSNPRLYVNILINIGLWNSTEGNYEEAAHYYHQAYEMVKTLNMPILMPCVLMNQADNEFKMGDVDLALQHAIQAMVAAHKMKIKPDEGIGMELLTRIYIEMGDYRRAFSSFRMQHRIQNEIQEEKFRHEIEQLKTKYEVKLKDLTLENDRFTQIISSYKDQSED